MISTRYNRNHSKRQVVMIPIGTSKFSGQTSYFKERLAFGVTIVGGNTRYGKSIITSNLMAHIGQYRPVIILDYVGEHFLRKFPNFLSEDGNTRCLGKLKQLNGVKFHISQFDKVGDWLSLGLSDHSSQIMTQLARAKKAHREDPKLFMDMLLDCPVSGQWGKEVKFKNKWGFEMPFVHAAAMDNARTHLNWMIRENFFALSTDPFIDYGELALKHGYLDINFNLDKSDIRKARAIAGKILEQIKLVLHKFSIPPLIVVEEADVLIPQDNDQSISVITSVRIATEFVLKLQKFGVEVIFVVQDLNRLAKGVWENFHNLILGQMPPSNPYHEYTKKLRWDIDANYREFYYRGKDGTNYDVIIPHDSATMY